MQQRLECPVRPLAHACQHVGAEVQLFQRRILVDQPLHQPLAQIVGQFSEPLAQRLGRAQQACCPQCRLLLCRDVAKGIDRLLRRRTIVARRRHPARRRSRRRTAAAREQRRIVLAAVLLLRIQPRRIVQVSAPRILFPLPARERLRVALGVARGLTIAIALRDTGCARAISGRAYAPSVATSTCRRSGSIGSRRRTPPCRMGRIQFKGSQQPCVAARLPYQRSAHAFVLNIDAHCTIFFKAARFFSPCDSRNNLLHEHPRSFLARDAVLGLPFFDNVGNTFPRIAPHEVHPSQTRAEHCPVLVSLFQQCPIHRRLPARNVRRHGFLRAAALLHFAEHLLQHNLVFARHVFRFLGQRRAALLCRHVPARFGVARLGLACQTMIGHKRLTLRDFQAFLPGLYERQIAFPLGGVACLVGSILIAADFFNQRLAFFSALPFKQRPPKLNIAALRKALDALNGVLNFMQQVRQNFILPVQQFTAQRNLLASKLRLRVSNVAKFHTDVAQLRIGAEQFRRFQHMLQVRPALCQQIAPMRHLFAQRVFQPRILRALGIV